LISKRLSPQKQPPVMCKLRMISPPSRDKVRAWLLRERLNQAVV
jgi:hypothetical protein